MARTTTTRPSGRGYSPIVGGASDIRGRLNAQAQSGASIPVAFPVGYDNRGRLTLEEARSLRDLAAPVYSEEIPDPPGDTATRLARLETLVTELQAALALVIEDNNTLKSRLREAGILEA